MRPDQRWFPTSRTERAAWFNNFAAQFTVIGADLGFTQAEIDAVNADNAVVQFSAVAINSLEAAMRAAREFERQITGGAANGSQPSFPPLYIPPPPAMVTSGIFARLERMVRRIRVAPAYDLTVGSLLGIIPANRRISRPADFIPKIKVQPLADAYTFSVRCARLSFNGFDVGIKRGDSAQWEKAGTFAISPAIIRLDPTIRGVPERVLVRVRMLKGDERVTRFSSAIAVTVNP